MGDRKHSSRRRIRVVLLGVFALLTLAGSASLSNAATSRVRATGAPTIKITGKPSNSTTSTKAVFTFSKTGTSVRVTCQLDGKTATSCSSPKTYTGLAFGAHTFVVKATNSQGSASASYAWRVVRPAPTVTLASPPSGSTTSTSMTLAWTSTNAAAILCWLDSAAPVVCAGPASYSDLALGTHTFTVKVSNESGSATVSATWTVTATDSTSTGSETPPPEVVPAPTGSETLSPEVVPAPTVSLASPPTSPTISTSATLAWTSTNATSIVCQLDTTSPATCASPLSYTDLAVGAHVFKVTVSNTSGSASASATWTVISAPDPPASPSGIQAPTSPTNYSNPAGAVTVSTSAALKTALAGSTRDIVLADGTYDNSSQFVNYGGHRLYAQNLGGAVLKAGIEMGGNDSSTGGRLQGITFDVSSSAKVLGGGIVHIWGTGAAGTEVLDCVLRGNKAIGYGILAHNPAGLVAQRLQFYDFTDVALWASDDQTASYGASTPIINSISDIYIDGVSKAVPGSSSGTGEAGVWVGHPVTNGVSRIKTRNVGWSGIETVNNAWGTTYSDLDIDMSGANESAGVGIYLEHFNYYNTFQRFSISGANVGINAEWNDPSWGGVAASHFSVFEDGTIDAAGASDAQTIGIWLDQGADSTTITRVKFLHQSWAAICEYKIAGTNNISGNDFSGLVAGVPTVSTGHP
jgi:hypothetical protein